MKKCQNIKTAISLWQQSIKGNSSWNSNTHIREYIYHTNGVGDSAYKIAGYCGLNQEKAYVLGLLHDYGKIQNEKKTGKAHFIVGYNKMIKLGLEEVAKICITHSFPLKKIVFENYPQYSLQDLKKAQEIISSLEYDDYDRLIQLCDMLFEGNNIVSYKERLSCISKRYNLSLSQTESLKQGFLQNKSYFDAKCGCSVYKILGIKE